MSSVKTSAQIFDRIEVYHIYLHIKVLVGLQLTKSAMTIMLMFIFKILPILLFQAISGLDSTSQSIPP